jgi:hypothetical protein
MIDLATQSRIQELFRRENRSFLQYISAATPWASAVDKPLVVKINLLAAEELKALEMLALWMESKRISLPYLGAFPTNFTSYNFVDIRKLLKPLVAEQRKELADLETNANSLIDDDSRKQIATLVELNRKHLGDMEQLGQPLAA